MTGNRSHIAEIKEINRLFFARDSWGALYEEITLCLYTAVLRPGDTSVDCGANVGTHSMAMSRSCGSGRVFAFEAVPDLLAAAEKKASGCKNIIWRNQLLWDVAGEEKSFNFYPQQSGLSGVLARAGTTECVPLTLTSTTLDQEVDGIVALIKLDLEGAEFHALKGAVRILEESFPTLVFENARAGSASKFGYDRDTFFNFFESRGYSLYFISGMPLTRELWDDPNHPWQFIAIHRWSPRAARVLAVCNSYRSFL